MIKESIRSVYRQLGGPALKKALKVSLMGEKQSLASASQPADEKSSLPLHGWTAAKAPVPLLDMLSDAQLEELNHILDYNCFTVDSLGRRFGLPAGVKKRRSPQELPDRRVLTLDAEVGLAGKRVLEVGCFEGVHTIALSERAKTVTALDSRVENVVKTIVRCAFYGHHPKVVIYDLETATGGTPEWMHAEVLFHVGVLYHLSDPVQHLKSVLENISEAILLDTHVARPDQLDAEYESNGRTWRYFRYPEKGYRAVFAGMLDHAKWLVEEDLHQVLKDSGFSTIKTLETRNENNGKRVLLIAKRSLH